MKHHHRRRDETPFIDPDFAEALGKTRGAGTSRQSERKTQQVCRQVQRALNLALADRFEEDGLNELFVAEVTPAPDCGHLLVHIVVPAGRPVTELLACLRRDAARLRSEVAAAINRKRAPELSFIPVASEGGRR